MLASQGQGYGKPRLTPEQQAELVAKQPEVFVPIVGDKRLAPPG
jgi:hypothetical protein